MTRDWFEENVFTWDELCDICYEEGYDLEYIYDEDGRDDRIYEDLGEMVTDESWQNIYSYLENIPTGYDMYYIYNEIQGTDDGDDIFIDFKNAFIDWMDETDRWEDEEGTGEYDEDGYEFAEPPQIPPEEPPIEDEPFTMESLMSECRIFTMKIISSTPTKSEGNDDFEALLTPFSDNLE